MTSHSLAEDVGWKFNDAVGNKQAHQGNVVPETDIELEVLGQSKEPHVANIHSIDEAE